MGNPREETRAQRIVERIIAEKDQFIHRRPKQVGRLAGRAVSRLRHSLDRKVGIDAATHLKEQEHLSLPDVEDHITVYEAPTRKQRRRSSVGDSRPSPFEVLSSFTASQLPESGVQPVGEGLDHLEFRSPDTGEIDF